jgi:signal transduction histidine kinase
MLRNTQAIDKGSDLGMMGMEAASLRQVACRVNLMTFCEAMKMFYRPLLQSRKIFLAFHIAPGLKQTPIDPVLLGKIMMPLISNAIVRNRLHGEVNIRLYRRQELHYMVGEIIATGLEIPEESLAEGLAGWELKNSKRILEETGGTLEAESEPGKGTIFTFTLPY